MTCIECGGSADRTSLPGVIVRIDGDREQRFVAPGPSGDNVVVVGECQIAAVSCDCQPSPRLA